MRSDRLALHVFPDALDPGFAPDTTLLHTPIRRQMIDGTGSVGIDPDLACFYFLCDVDRAFDVAAPNGAAQSVDRAIGAGEGIVKIVIADDGYRRTKLLFRHQLGIVGNVRDHDRAHEIASRKRCLTVDLAQIGQLRSTASSVV